MAEKAPWFQLWWEGNEYVCKKNFNGSSPAMESEGALKLFQRSQEKLIHVGGV